MASFSIAPGACFTGGARYARTCTHGVNTPCCERFAMMMSSAVNAACCSHSHSLVCIRSRRASSVWLGTLTSRVHVTSCHRPDFCKRCQNTKHSLLLPYGVGSCVYVFVSTTSRVITTTHTTTMSGDTPCLHLYASDNQQMTPPSSSPSSHFNVGVVISCCFEQFLECFADA